VNEAVKASATTADAKRNLDIWALRGYKKRTWGILGGSEDGDQYSVVAAAT
jgi:hypothetical protein